MLRVLDVEPNSIAEEIGILVGDTLVEFDGCPIADVLDYHYYDGQEEFSLTVLRGDEHIIFDIEKYADESLGLDFGEQITTRSCRNKCIFCFVDQLPKGMRKPLYVKDDDWRLSFVSGNYVTLTNLKKGELQRIVDKQFSPIYISVHSTRQQLREFMLGTACENIMEQIKFLYAGGIEIHAQAVVVPDVNDGSELAKTIADLAPYVASMAAVPVGLTKYSNPDLKVFTAQTAGLVLNIINDAQKHNLKTYGKRLVFAADEFYFLAEQRLPSYEEYEDFPQIENGVGMCAQFYQEVVDSLEYAGKPKYKDVAIATGVAAHRHISNIAEIIANKCNTRITVYRIVNNFFGETVNVAGLITGGDLIAQLKGISADCLLIPRTMLKEFDTVFLDGVSVDEVKAALMLDVIPVEVDGNALINILTECD